MNHLYKNWMLSPLQKQLLKLIQSPKDKNSGNVKRDSKIVTLLNEHALGPSESEIEPLMSKTSRKAKIVPVSSLEKFTTVSHTGDVYRYVAMKKQKKKESSKYVSPSHKFRAKKIKHKIKVPRVYEPSSPAKYSQKGYKLQIDRSSDKSIGYFAGPLSPIAKTCNNPNEVMI